MALKRHDPAVVADDVRRFLSDPNAQRTLENARELIMQELSEAQADGSEAFEAWEREMCRTLRTMYRMEHGLKLLPQLDDLRSAGYRPKAPAENEDGY